MRLWNPALLSRRRLPSGHSLGCQPEKRVWEDPLPELGVKRLSGPRDCRPVVPGVAVGWALGGSSPPRGCLGPHLDLGGIPCPPAQGSLDHPWPWACLLHHVSFQSRTLCPYIGHMLVSRKRGLFPWLEFLLDSPP